VHIFLYSGIISQSFFYAFLRPEKYFEKKMKKCLTYGSSHATIISQGANGSPPDRRKAKEDNMTDYEMIDLFFNFHVTVAAIVTVILLIAKRE
jgi:hypothetical protein